MNITRRSICFSLLSLPLLGVNASAQENNMHHHATGSHKAELGTSAAVDPQGRLWVATTEPANDETAPIRLGSRYVVLQMSPDMGKTWSTPKRVQQKPEPIEAAGESRPKLAFGLSGEIYVAYTMPLNKPYTGEIRFVRSIDGGQTFSPPVTVHANRDLITHRFESMIVDKAGRLYIAWIDKRDGDAAKAHNAKFEGASIYYAISDNRGASFKGDYRLVEHTCECCRIGLALNLAGRPVAMWRHIFEPNIRDHALGELSPDGKPTSVTRVTFDDWHVDACPHHGPSVAYAADGTRHQVWFDVKGDEGGVFYASASPSGKLTTPMQLGSAQAEHADVASKGKNVVVAWKQFDGKSTKILTKVSGNNGASWQERVLSETRGNSDHPHLIVTKLGILLVWRTQNEGIQIVPINQSKV